jgi:hypothetical protein
MLTTAESCAIPSSLLFLSFLPLSSFSLSPLSSSLLFLFFPPLLSFPLSPFACWFLVRYRYQCELSRESRGTARGGHLLVLSYHSPIHSSPGHSYSFVFSAHIPQPMLALIAALLFVVDFYCERAAAAAVEPGFMHALSMAAVFSGAGAVVCVYVCV